jgi:carbon storage regulator
MVDTGPQTLLEAVPRERPVSNQHERMPMLILSRRSQESFVIGEGENAVLITLVRIEGEKAKIGIAAPRDVPVHRLEVYRNIHGEEAVAKLVARKYWRPR